jgi:hypothetical protein
MILLILALSGIWLILDDQKGNKYLTKFIKNMITSTSLNEKINKEQEKDKATATGIPTPLLPKKSNSGMFDPNAPTVNRENDVAYD